MLDNTNCLVQVVPELKRLDAALNAEHADLESGRLRTKAHLDPVTDESGLAEKFDRLGATLLVRHSCLCSTKINVCMTTQHMGDHLISCGSGHMSTNKHPEFSQSDACAAQTVC